MRLMSMIVFLNTETNARNARFKNGAQNAAHAKSEQRARFHCETRSEWRLNMFYGIY